MKNISIRSTLVLCLLGGISISTMLLVEFSKKEQAQPHTQAKLKAAQLMQDCITHLKESHFKDEVAIDNINDPNDSRIIGTRFSAITSGRGSLPVKLSTVNPNFAALLVELYKEAELEKGDHIAIGATGSFPALNIAACAAAEVLGLKVSYIGSVTSSSWGANDPEYTFLDMHATLLEGELLSQKILAASIGANQDIGRTLSPQGRALAKAAVERNKLNFIHGKSLQDNINERLRIYKEQEMDQKELIKLYVNVGGGIASLGSNQNAESLPSGLMKDVKLDEFADKKGVMFEMASNGVPLINLKKLNYLMTKYKLPRDPVPLPQIGDGPLFYELKYDLQYVFGVLTLLISMIAGVIIYDKRQHALGTDIIQQETHS